MRLPNFFIIGAPKCGTTSMAAWLSEHPNIYFSPIKEPFFFSIDLSRQFVSTWEDYKNLFINSTDQHLAIGEGSTHYLFSKVAVPKIEREIPDSKYVVMVRNPVEMAYALHEQHLFSGLEDVQDFATAWNLSSERRNSRHVPPACKKPFVLDYQSICKIGEQIERLYRTVPRDRVLILVLDDIKISPRNEYLKVLNFLKLPDDRREEFPVYNIAKVWRPAWFGEFMKRAKRVVYKIKYEQKLLPKQSLGLIPMLQKFGTQNRKRPPMPDSLRQDLEAYFAEDVHLLEQLLHRDFSHWYEQVSE